MTKPKPLPPINELKRKFVYDERNLVLLNVTEFATYSKSIVSGKDKYSTVTCYGEEYLMHRVIWALHYGEDPGDQIIDHINRQKGDNRVNNLRIVSPLENALNSSQCIRIRITYSNGEVVEARTMKQASEILGVTRETIKTALSGEPGKKLKKMGVKLERIPWD